MWQKGYLDQPVLFTGLVVFCTRPFLIEGFLVGTPYKVMDDPEDDVDGEGGGYLGDDDSLVVVDIIHVVECIGDGHFVFW